MAASYSIGQPDLDDDHDHMIVCWRELESSGTLAAAKAAATQLMTQTTEHFAREEAFMAQCGYPDLVRHKKLHAEMAAALRNILLSPLLGNGRHEEFILAVRSLMNKWVAAHILGEDAKLTPYARAQGALPARKAAARR